MLGWLCGASPVSVLRRDVSELSAPNLTALNLTALNLTDTPSEPTGIDALSPATPVDRREGGEPRVVVVTAAGRRDRMQLLVRHLAAHAQAGSIDEWHLWENTREREDREFLQQLAHNSSSWVRLVDWPDGCDRGYKGSDSGITCFWRDPAVQQTLFSHTIIRLDDDIVWLDDSEALRGWVRFTIDNPSLYVTYANVINNGVSLEINQQHCHQLTQFQTEEPDGDPDDPQCVSGCGNLWANGTEAVELHRFALQVGPASLRCNQTVDTTGRRYSINAVAWHGPHMAMKRPGALPHNLAAGNDEEEDLTRTIPNGKNLSTAFYGGCVAAHLSFYTQDANVSEAPDLLAGYLALAPDADDADADDADDADADDADEDAYPTAGPMYREDAPASARRTV